MTLNAYSHRNFLLAALLLPLLVLTILSPAPAFALGNGESTLPEFAEFSRAVQNNEANVLRGVYVQDVLALPITQQPTGNAGYVSSNAGEVTQFGLAAQFGNVGLLAHNYLSGRLFMNLEVGQEVRMIYGNGNVESFVITKILQFQALEPNSPYSTFRDVSNDEMLSAEQLFHQVYGGERHVTFQTCIAGPGSMSWGRLFVIAVPATETMDLTGFDIRIGR